MKKILSLILALIMCLSLCACGKKQETDAEQTDLAQTITWEELISASSNPAKMKLNEGKGITVFGKITNLTAEYCIIDSFLNNFKIQVYIPTEQLAKMNKEQFVALDSVITASDDGTNPYGVDFFASCKKTLDLTNSKNQEKMDEHLKSLYKDLTSLYEFKETLNVKMVYNYVQSRGDAFKETSDDDLSNYLIGKWGRQNFDTFDFQADGNGTWHYVANTPLHPERDQNDSWSVSNGRIKYLPFGIDTTIYILSENLCFLNGTLSERISDK